MNKIPFPTIIRMSYMFDALDKLEQANIKRVSSSELGEYTGQNACVIRKDIHLLEYDGVTGVRYDVAELKRLLQNKLGFCNKRNACIIGLGKLGSAILEHLISVQPKVFSVVAGFDSNVNRLETIRTSIELFPAHRIEEIIRLREIELALIAVPFLQAQEIADKCCDGGISGILNFSPLSIKAKRKDVVVRSCDIGSELNILAAMTFLR